MYSELHCKTNYSFLTGGSHADELVVRAAQLGYRALAITDENTLAGVVRAYGATREINGKSNAISDGTKETNSLSTLGSLKLIIGAEIVPNDGPPILLWAPDRLAYADLSKLITVGRRRASKGECWLSVNDIANYSKRLLAGVVPYFRGDRLRTDHIDETHRSYQWHAGDAATRTSGADDEWDGETGMRSTRWKGWEKVSNQYREMFGDRAYLMAALYHGVDDAWRIEQLKQLSRKTNLPLVASGDVLYHARARLPLHDVQTAIKHRTTVALAGDLLLPNAQRHLQSIEERQQAFQGIPDAVERINEIVERCDFCLSQLRYEYPEELAPEGQEPIEHLRNLTMTGAANRYPQGMPAKVQAQIDHELQLIRELRYEAYFLTVWDLVRFARSRGILCQGRGSAANSAVCYCLGVTSVDPETTDLLFERFISKERDEAPDIDVDFEHERREEVLQYLYNKYGRDRAGLAATVISYRIRSAVRDVGKALGLSLDRVDALAKQVEGNSSESDLSGKMQAVGIDPESEVGVQMNHLVGELLGFPRHLSQHVGGMVITQGKLDELVPIENASMDDRTVIQWDKDDLEELGLLKVDCLCLGMLSAIRKCFHMVEQHWGRPCTLANLPPDDPKVYDMICAADTVGVFQIESRGQMSMLPRLKPRCWYDLVIEVAIVRPGPIQGNMVHPYLRRRSGEEAAVYPNEEIKAVLQRTLGVPIFQEQAMKLAVVAAGFTPGEADQLRRAMGKWRKTGVIQQFHEKLIKGMKARGLTGEFAEQVFRQISGFGEYGFPESHAASFAKLVYVSAWLKYYYPAAFCAAIINSFPMGFYAPAQLVADAKKHGVKVLPVDVNHSQWDCTIEHGEENRCAVGESKDGGALKKANSTSRLDGFSAKTDQPFLDQRFLRLGLRMISGLRSNVAELIIDQRRHGPFTSVSDFTRRTRLGQAVIAQLSQADAFGSVNQDRRAALWQALGQEKKAKDQPLFAGLETEDDETLALPELVAQDQVTADYRSVGLSLRAHPLSFHRDLLNELKVTCCAELSEKPNNRHLRVAGLVILRQRPSTAKGITFVTLEDETGTANLVVKQGVWQRYYKVARRSSAWIAHGKLEMKSGVIHVVVNRLEDMSFRLEELQVKSRDFR
ncbi:MAG: error-prone DNA polymerase [Mariniblastus sp.]|nr:error-prone DNA polymerase [Mariniblastus sp.]